MNSLNLSELTLDTSYTLNTSGNDFISRIIESNKLPFSKYNIYYSDTIWDFSTHSTTHISPTKQKFNFENISPCFQQDIKKYLLVQLIENRIKFQSIHRKFSCLRVFFNYLYSNNIYSIQEVHSEQLEGFLEGVSNTSPITQQKYKEAILNFYTFYSNHIVAILTPEIVSLLSSSNSTLIKVQAENNKYPNIPSNYFNNLMICLIKSLNTDIEPIDLKATACLLIILSQTGLRAAELAALEIDNLKYLTLYDGTIRYFLEYKTWKRESGNNVFSTEKTYVNDLTYKAFSTLVDLLKEERLKRDTKYLFFVQATKKVPLVTQRLRDNFLKYYFTHRTELGCINCPDKFPELQKTLYQGKYVLSYPATPQYRVRVCTELYNNNVPLAFIQKFMGHLSAEMQGYYVRPKTDVQEDIEFSKKVILGILSSDTKLLGSNAESFTKRINDFIKENHYSISTDINSIAETLLDTIPIRAKSGGVCIKSSKFRECTNDSFTNKFYCAYGVCPNVFHFYYMSNISYRQCLELKETITLNITRKHLKQAQKEINMLNTVLSNKLLPELEELSDMLSKKGHSYIITTYPDLEYIVNNLEDIYKEIEQWQQLKIE